ncbi:hypothetical protein [Candidatus Protochlamydia phocaeensis]|uniref:hypothetical protein n=1 Tax=Candidatus Protochlamydia phocaeensis TaxID=1414722 RepID=UPI000838B680|nr:hypothetical protein [Candidatus Protochlamydia phocaeensis]
MKKIILCLFLILLSATNYAEQIYLENQPIREWENKNYSIKLKQVYLDPCDTLWAGGEKSITFAYIIQINSPLSEREGLIFLEFLDEDGFSLNSNMIKVCTGNFTGTIKGDFVVPLREFEKYKNFKSLELSYTPEISWK